MCVMGCNVCLTSFLPTALMSRGISEQTAGILAYTLYWLVLVWLFVQFWHYCYQNC